MNRIFLMGRFGKDPELKYTAGDKPVAVARFSLAVDRKFKKGETDFFNCSAFGSTAEFIEKYFKKGMKALIEGRIENSQYTNKDGQKVTATGVIVEAIEFCEKKEQAQEKKGDELIDIPEADDELPFKF